VRAARRPFPREERRLGVAPHLRSTIRGVTAMTAIRRLWLVGLSSVLLGACGGATSNVGPGGDGGTEGGSGSDGGTGNDAAADAGGGGACPSSPPTAGAACPQTGLECEYGTNPNPSCNQIVQCTNTGWVDQGNTGCPAGQCPATYASVPLDQNCKNDNGVVCSYAEGTCTCSFGAPPHTNGPVWQCFVAKAGCPSPRPDIGTTCTSPGESCDYGACQGGIALKCSGGVWQQDEVACPG
jgi:hypothetical protein